MQPVYLHPSLVVLTIVLTLSEHVTKTEEEASGPPCNQPLNFGKLCKHATEAQSVKKSYYFNKDKACCASFRYLGCWGNENNFDTAKRCVQKCLAIDGSIEEEDEEVNNILAKQDCALKPEVGPCRALIPMWYYDPDKNQCGTFAWGGCQGNYNKFSDESSCLEFCRDFRNYTEMKVPSRPGVC